MDNKFEVGATLRLNENWFNSNLRKRFLGKLIRYSKRECDRHGMPCARIKRLDLESNRIELWGQEFLKDD